ncbi:MAG: hypothetical protein H0W88_04810 [Parachlamydiaceae bacterium]|nr:hypothetical protein [Parachlamydiaceae bacterium]
MTATTSLYTYNKEFENFKVMGNHSPEEASVIIIEDPYEDDLSENLGPKYNTFLETIAKIKPLQFCVDSFQCKPSEFSKARLTQHMTVAKADKILSWSISDYVTAMNINNNNKEHFEEDWKGLRAAIVARCIHWKQTGTKAVDLTAALNHSISKVNESLPKDEAVNSRLGFIISKFQSRFNAGLENASINAEQLANQLIEHMKLFMMQGGAACFINQEDQLEESFYLKNMETLTQVVAKESHPDRCLVIIAKRHFMVQFTADQTLKKGVGTLNCELAKHKFVKIVLKGTDTTIESQQKPTGTAGFKEEKKEDSSKKGDASKA